MKIKTRLPKEIQKRVEKRQLGGREVGVEAAIELEKEAVVMVDLRRRWRWRW